MSSALSDPGPHGRAAVAHRIFECADLGDVRRQLLREAASHELDVQGAAAESFTESILDTRDHRLERAGAWVLSRDFGEGYEVEWQTLPADQLRAVAGRRALRPTVRLDVVREELVVKRRGNWVGTVIFTEATGVADRGAPIAIARVEWRVALKADGSSHPVFAALEARDDLRPTATPLHAAAAELAGHNPKRPNAGIEVHLGMTTGELAIAVLRRQLREIRKREPGTRLGADPEELHRMRVAVRRLRAALRLWRPVLGPEARELQSAWDQVGRALGETRDLDVESEHLASWAASLPVSDRMALAPIETWVENRRATARTRMLEVLDSPAHERLVRFTSQWLRAGPGRSLVARRPARRAVADLVRERHRALMRRARRVEPTSPPEDCHRVRILAKHLRYCLEFHARLLGPAARELVKNLVAIQDLLGEYQDSHVFVDRFGRLGEDASVGATPRALELIAERAEERKSRAIELRAAFPEALRSVRGAAWRELKSELGAGRSR